MHLTEYISSFHDLSQVEIFRGFLRFFGVPSTSKILCLRLRSSAGGWVEGGSRWWWGCVISREVVVRESLGERPRNGLMPSCSCVSFCRTALNCLPCQKQRWRSGWASHQAMRLCYQERSTLSTRYQVRYTPSVFNYWQEKNDEEDSNRISVCWWRGKRSCLSGMEVYRDNRVRAIGKGFLIVGVLLTGRWERRLCFFSASPNEATLLSSGTGRGTALPSYVPAWPDYRRTGMEKKDRCRRLLALKKVDNKNCLNLRSVALNCFCIYIIITCHSHQIYLCHTLTLPHKSFREVKKPEPNAVNL